MNIKYNLRLCCIILSSILQISVFGESAESSQLLLSKGVDLFYMRCGACHPVIPPSKNGPHLYGIVGFYRMENPDSLKFTNAVISFLDDPESNSKMTREIKQFGLMPKMIFEKTELDLITSAMWNFERAEAWTSPFSKNKVEDVPLNEGGRLFLINCGACHSLLSANSNGPSAIEIVKAYTDDDTDIAFFKKKIAVFLQNPDTSATLMKKDLKNFGIKPKMKIDDQELEQITKWMWDEIKKRISK